MVESEQTPLWTPKHTPGTELKGGGQRGGPKRWTGNGPRPARHIPWPEIFKHHISVVEGHLKMIDMVRKHTVPETGNWKTITGMVERTNELLRMSKQVSNIFVPPADFRDQVPIGSSSASMYPGYSPADHEYGKAASEFGQEVQKAKAQGVEFKTSESGPQFEIGSRLKNKALLKCKSGNREETNGSGVSALNNDITASPVNGAANGATDGHGNSEDTKGDANPYFVIDTNPAPVNISEASHMPMKRESRSQSPEPAKKKSKKPKTSHDGAVPSTMVAGVEFEDISGEVDARMKEKEEKRKKKEKKRKRDSGASEPVEAVATEPTVVIEKPKKKKAKKTEETESTPQKRPGSGDGDSEGKKKKKLKKDK